MNSNIQTIMDGFNVALRQIERKDRDIKLAMKMNDQVMEQMHDPIQKEQSL